MERNDGANAIFMVGLLKSLLARFTSSCLSIEKQTAFFRSYFTVLSRSSKADARSALSILKYSLMNDERKSPSVESSRVIRPPVCPSLPLQVEVVAPIIASVHRLEPSKQEKQKKRQTILYCTI